MSRFYSWLNLLNEGGAYGHLTQIWENTSFTFSDLKNIVKKSLAGELDMARLKTDGQNIMFTWKNNQIRFARNKSHLKNFGEDSLTASELSRFFAGRGSLSDAFDNAAIDLQSAVSKLSDSQRESIFKNGKKFMSCEIMYTENENIIHYGVNELRFHGTKEFDENGNEIDDNKKDGDILANMIKKIHQEKQKTFHIKPLEVVNLPKTPDFNNQVKKYVSMIDKVKSRFKLNDNSTINDYVEAYFIDLLNKRNLPYNNSIIDRWANGNKRYKINHMKKDFPDHFDKLKEIDSNIASYYKDCIQPIERVILQLGVDVLQNITNFMVLDPDKTKKNIKQKLDNAIKEIRSKGGPDMIDKLNKELERLQSIGGVDKIFPEEGITFIYKDGFYKFTGLFAPLNQLINLTWQLKN